jgi:hypothetical protein
MCRERPLYFINKLPRPSELCEVDCWNSVFDPLSGDALFFVAEGRTQNYEVEDLLLHGASVAGGCHELTRVPGSLENSTACFE